MLAKQATQYVRRQSMSNSNESEPVRLTIERKGDKINPVGNYSEMTWQGSHATSLSQMAGADYNSLDFIVCLEIVCLEPIRQMKAAGI